MGDAYDDPNLTTIGLFFEANAALQRALQRQLESECGLSVQWFEVMLRLRRSPGTRLRMSELAAQTTLTPSGLTRAIDRLVEAGFVAREHCPEDRRGAWAVLTADGRSRIDAAVPVHLAHLEQLVVGVIGERELADLGRVSRKLRDALNPTGEDLGCPTAS